MAAQVLAAGIIVSYYNSMLLSALDQWNGTRYYRYRELVNSVWGASWNANISSCR